MDIAHLYIVICESCMSYYMFAGLELYMIAHLRMFAGGNLWPTET